MIEPREIRLPDEGTYYNPLARYRNPNQHTTTAAERIADFIDSLEPGTVVSAMEIGFGADVASRSAVSRVMKGMGGVRKVGSGKATRFVKLRPYSPPELMVGGRARRDEVLLSGVVNGIRFTVPHRKVVGIHRIGEMKLEAVVAGWWQGGRLTGAM